MVDELGRVFTWGQGRYGATGLGETADTYAPTWVAALDHPRGEIRSVACGHTVTVMHGKLTGHRYLAGVLDPRSQETNMTPKQFFGMGHCRVRDIAFWKRGFELCLIHSVAVSIFYCHTIPTIHYVACSCLCPC